MATTHRVRNTGKERWSVPFFCEPGVDAVVGEGEERYGEFVLGKMGGWVEFQPEAVGPDNRIDQTAVVEVGA